MNRSQRNRSNQRRRNNQPTRSSGVDIWRTSRPLPEIEPIAPSKDVGALLRSLGDPPITGGTMSGHYFNAVIERAAGVAMALALSADLLASPEDRD